MTPSNAPPYDWARELEAAIIDLDDIPLMGKTADFPWNELSSKLATCFGIEDIQVSSEAPEWLDGNQLQKGVATPVNMTGFNLTGLSGTVSWLMSEQDIISLMSLLLTGKGGAISGIDADLQKGFYKFFLLEILQSIEQLDFDNTLSVQICEDTPAPEGPHLGMNVTLSAKGKKVVGRLLLSGELVKSWRASHTEGKPRALTEEMKQSVEVTCHLEIGRTELTLNEIKAIEVGDFVICDRLTYDPDTEKGRVMLTANNRPAFRARLKKGNLKILEFPQIHEDMAAMDDASLHDIEEEEEEEEFEEEGGITDELEDEVIDEDEIIDDDEELDIPEEEEEVYESEEAIAAEAHAASEQAPIQPSKREQAAISPDEIPLELVIEVGALRMPVGKLLEMQPGNVLEIGVAPEDGVNLVVKGKRIGRGELLRIGDALGVRVLELANS